MTSLLKFGATIGARTRDLILTMDALYQLSYRGMAPNFNQQVCSSASVLRQNNREIVPVKR